MMLAHRLISPAVIMSQPPSLPTLSQRPARHWFVGASYGYQDDQLPRFLAEGIWENGYHDRYQEAVRQMQVGEYIAVKAAYTRKYGLPPLLQQRDKVVSVMNIKAIGVITANPLNGKSVAVNWLYQFPTIKEWYRYTFRNTIQAVTYGHDPRGDALIAFAFDQQPQNIADFLPASPAISPADVLSEPEEPLAESELDRYSVEDIVSEGCFLAQETLARFLTIWRQKKNLILQGPPGTGKTWLAKRLAFALIGYQRQQQLRAVQFHANVSYEDFVRGWRPTAEGKLLIRDGVLLQLAQQAQRCPDVPFVLLIEEINRGQPAQIFGECLTLLEASKRTPSEALLLSYPDAEGQLRPFYLPDNLYLIGTMNTADRSLAVVDFALRRRFAFITLTPAFNSSWLQWLEQTCAVPLSLADTIRQRMLALNEHIAADMRLGPAFCLGHSYATPHTTLSADTAWDWWSQCVTSEIQPLLQEYWFDAPDQVETFCQQLLATP